MSDDATEATDEWELPTSFEGLVGRFARSAQVDTVFGDPIEAEAGTVVPVARSGYGLGFGYGSGHDSEPADGERQVSEGSGGGGGGGVGITPVGYVEITDGGTRFVRFGGRRRGVAAFAAGVALGVAVAVLAAVFGKEYTEPTD